MKNNVGATSYVLNFKSSVICGFSVAQPCPTLCNPMDCSMPGFPVHHCLPEFTQIHVHWVGDSIQPPHPLQPSSPCAFIFPSIRVFSNELSLHIRWPKHWSFSFSISLSNECLGLISYVVQEKKPSMVSVALDTVSIPSSTPCSGAGPCSGCWGSNGHNRGRWEMSVSPDPNRPGPGCGSFPSSPLNLGVVTQRWGNKC